MSVEDERQRLYGLPLEEFTAERNRTARELRRSGEREEAAAIAALPKPTLAAWTVNALSRHRRREVDLLLDSGKRLYDAQRASLETGEREGLDRARRSLEAATAEALRAARDVLGERASEQTLGRVGETLRSAALTPEGRELLATGSLTRELTTTGWDLITGLGASVPRERRRSRRARGGEAAVPQRSSSPQTRGREQLTEARAALRLARERRSEAGRHLRSVTNELARAGEALERAQAAHRQAKADAAEAEDAVKRAETAVREAEKGRSRP